MRTALVLATLMIFSITIPAGILLSSPSATTGNLGEVPKKAVSTSVVQNPKEDIPNVAVQVPEPSRVAEAPKIDVPNVAQQPPQKPQQELLPLPSIRQEIPREGIPQNFVFKEARLVVQTFTATQTRTAKTNLTDMQLIAFSKLKDALLQANTTVEAWKERCKRYDPDRLGIGDCGQNPPAIVIALTQDEAAIPIQMINPDPYVEKTVIGSGYIGRYYDSIVSYQGLKYVVSVLVVWGPP